MPLLLRFALCGALSHFHRMFSFDVDMHVIRRTLYDTAQTYRASERIESVISVFVQNCEKARNPNYKEGQDTGRVPLYAALGCTRIILLCVLVLWNMCGGC